MSGDGDSQGAWTRHTDDEGSVYYHNTVTDETTWDKPEGFQDDGEDNGENKGSWEKHTTDDGEVYYHNTVSDETTWDKPEGFQDDDDDAENDLPAAGGDGGRREPTDIGAGGETIRAGFRRIRQRDR